MCEAWCCGRGLVAAMASRTTQQSSREGSPAFLLDPRSGISWTPGSSRENSPIPSDRLSLPHTAQGDDVRASPRLSRRVLKELKSVEEEMIVDGNDPSFYSPWTFWFEKPVAEDVGDYSQRLRNLYTVKSIKVFWCVYNNLKLASELENRQCYHLMRGSDRKPLWEDESNISGGMWVFRCKKEDTNFVWREVLLAAIGEQFADCTAKDDDVVGVSIKIRYREDVIQIWNKAASHREEAVVVQKLRNLLSKVEIRGMFYSSNQEKMNEPPPPPRYPNPAPRSDYPRPPAPLSYPPGMLPPRPPPSQLPHSILPRMPPPPHYRPQPPPSSQYRPLPPPFPQYRPQPPSRFPQPQYPQRPPPFN